MKQTICDKCKKKLIVSKIKIKYPKEFLMKDDMESMLGGLGDIFGDALPEWRTEVEGSIIKVYLPKYKMNNVTYDLCEKCTKKFLDENIKKWLKVKTK